MHDATKWLLLQMWNVGLVAVATWLLIPMLKPLPLLIYFALDAYPTYRDIRKDLGG